MKKVIFIILSIFVLSTNIFSQDFHFGIRGGMNFSTMQGPLSVELNEKYSMNNGFHFGVEVLYTFNDLFSVGSGVEYSQVGAKYDYAGPSYYIFFNEDYGDNFVLKNDTVSYNLNISNSYIYIPLNIRTRIFEKFELKVGGYFGFLINPIANGTMDFGSKFTQRLKYNYYSDKSAASIYDSFGTLYINTVEEDGDTEVRTTNQIARAYYEYPSDDYDNNGSFYKVFDAGVNIGLNYFVNKSLYFGITAQYGLTDITNNKLDRDLEDFNDNGDLYYDEDDDSMIYKSDFDRNLNLQLSLGFRF